MREIAIAAKAENELIMVLIGKSQKDSYLIKLMTVIALLYLPANLVAVREPANTTLRTGQI